MNTPDHLVLPKDVLVVPVTDLPTETRQQFRYRDDDYALTRLNSRTYSKIVGPEVAALLRQFETPRSIIDAVINYSLSQGVNPEDTLEEAYPIITSFVAARILVHPDSEDATRISATYRIGDSIGQFVVQRCVQVLDDTEIYHVRTPAGGDAALKLSRPVCGSSVDRAFNREVECLRRLDGAYNPKLISSGVLDGRKYLVMEWCEGVPATVAAEELRRSPYERKKLVELCLSIVSAYAHLHSQGVIHSDVHPGNILVDRSGRVRILDFGLSHFDNAGLSEEAPPRGGIGFYFEPEFAHARLHCCPAPEATQLGEQYSLAAMLYFLLAGVQYQRFSLEKAEMTRQIAEDPPIPLSVNVGDWPPVEAVLMRALSKSPSDRFASLSKFRDALARIAAEQSPSATPPSRHHFLDQVAARELIESIATTLEDGGETLFGNTAESPIGSVTYGAAGISYALYRLSCLRSEPRLLTLSDIWSDRAASALSTNEAFYNEALEISPETVGRTALYHTASGVHAVHAMVSHAMGNFGAAQSALADFIAASTGACENLDLTLGRSSTLVGCALLQDVLSRSGFVQLADLTSFGDEVLADVWRRLNLAPPIPADDRVVPYLGIAHGWAGMLYAALLWCRSANRALPSDVGQRLLQLAECAEPKGRGVRWKIRRGGDQAFTNNYTAGWCNGTAGQVFLWTLASRVLGEDDYLVMAERAAWNAWEDAYGSDSLCCGLAGEAYGLLNLYKCSGDRQWLLRAHDLAGRAMTATRSSSFPQSLYKGSLGVGVLLGDLLESDNPCMPLFELEYASD